ncbi:protein MOTHER of FT and TFL1-like isoform X2 [Euphorbia lathyris]|uniref:protein MOTHER of FT and TFL1-like isoform X2 n=1 Tax=Euphorbia lathyris TaxID=212925 RepID=UPI003313A451
MLNFKNLLMSRDRYKVEPHILGRIIGDVVDKFTPIVTMSLCYGPKHVRNGCDIKPSMVVDPPKIKFTGRPDYLYTLVMVDPDAPSPCAPTMREWLHWYVTDIPGGSDISKGKEITPYESPCPRIGVHRFVFVLFQQKEPLGLVNVPQSRKNFSTRLLAADLDLGLPAAVVFFHAQRESAPSRR